MKNVLKTLLLTCLLALVVSCDRDCPEVDGNFDALMGLGKAVCSQVRSEQDRESVAFYKALYNENQNLQFERSETTKIPRILHVIWMGPRPFPARSLDNLYLWVENHPDWVVKFWTDRERVLPHPKMQVNMIKDVEFSLLRNCFYESDCFIEKSEILRYEILYQEGGIYFDHYMQCMQSMLPLAMNYDFFCAIAPSSRQLINNGIVAGNHVIGARPGHPVMLDSINLIKERWHRIADAFPGQDKDSMLYRACHRTFSSFDAAVRGAIGQNGNTDIVLPTGYFNQVAGKFGVYANCLKEQELLDSSARFEKMVQTQLAMITQSNQRTVFFNGLLILLNGLVIAFLVVKCCKRKKS